MLYFVNDYSEGAHEKVLQHLIDTNMKQLSGYGTDHYCETAKEKIKKACGCEDAEVYLLTGGTQTNQIVIDTMLAPYEGVVAAQTGHFREWSIFHIRQNMELYTAKKSWKSFPPCAENISCRFFSTEQD